MAFETAVCLFAGRCKRRRRWDAALEVAGNYMGVS